MRGNPFNIPISLGILLFALGSILFLLHYPYSLQFRLSGLTLTFVFYLLRFINKEVKQTQDKIKVILVCLWSATAFVRIQHLFNHPVLTWITFGIIIYWGSLQIKGYMQNVGPKPSRKAQLNHKVFLIAACILSLGFLFKTMHWPGANTHLIVGILLTATWAILETFRKK